MMSIVGFNILQKKIRGKNGKIFTIDEALCQI